MKFYSNTERDEDDADTQRRRERRRERERDRPDRKSRRAGEQDDGEGAWETVRKGVATTQVIFIETIS
jgi:hypothetical protein